MGRGGAHDVESDYGDTAPRSNKAGAFFGALHTLFAVLTIACGIALIVTGGWAIANQNDAAYSDLKWSGSLLAANVYLGIVSVVVGVALIVLAILGMLAIGQGCCSIFAAIIYFLAMLVLVAATALTASVLLLVAAGGGPGSNTRSFVSDVWQETVVSEPQAACELEREFRCRGFFDNDCVGCSSAAAAAGTCTAEQRRVCANCTSVPSSGDFATVGCYDELLSRMQRVARPVGIAAAIAAGVGGIGLFVFLVARCTV
ncbi:hypothetical protein I4F81_002123 [Pyropia yezoensis]|uniref:Uncharacterized protein n=1 Tax=Pyropia yezoensis TaxID=2788 RepID=A0ACC3BPJ5_PYRYE|nr:hypothetical protein I4F81_002123 [Neopyropia yezoensis]